MATYRYHPMPNQLLLESRVIYGSSRVGIDGAKAAPLNDPAFNPSGVIQYELTDHLGNVAVTVTDELVAVDEGQDLDPANDYNGPVIVSAQGYEPFGSLLPGRNFSSDSYRHGFNGMEKDDEVHNSTGTSYDFGARLYDPRVGRWLSLDPLARKFAGHSTYSFAFNSPLIFVDQDGKEPIRPQVTSVTALITALRAADVSDLDGLLAYFGGNEQISVPTGTWGEERYLYSGSNGWLDMRHFSAAAAATDKWYITGAMVLEEGENTERNQEAHERSSAWSYEDLPSNRMGVDFESFLENNDGEFLDVLDSYLRGNGFVDNPLDVAPNAAELPDSYPDDAMTPPSATNRTYTPMYTLVTSVGAESPSRGRDGVQVMEPDNTRVATPNR